MKKAIFTFTLSFITVIVVSAQMSDALQRQSTRFYNLGIEALSEKDYITAVSSFSEAIELNDGHALSYLNRGRAYALSGNMEQAVMDIDRAIIADPGLGEAHFYKAYFLLETDTTGLVTDHLEKSVALGFEPPQAFYFLGLKTLETGNNEKALLYFNKAINKKDDYALAYHDRAGIKKNIGDYSGALYDYQAAVNYREVFPIAYNNMGCLKMILGNYKGAILDFDKAIAQDPEYFMAHNNRGYGYYQLGEMEIALESFSKALGIKSVFMEASLNKACVYAREKKFPEALDLMDQVIIDNPEEGILYINRGLIRELKGDVIGACKDWKLALELGEKEVEDYLEECK